jgi:hypothetical protein
MRSARILLATAAASAALVLSTPGAYAEGSGWDHDSSSSSQEDSSSGKEHKDHDGPWGGVHTGGGALAKVNEDSSHGKEHKDHDGPWGGMHTGGGALSMVNEDDWGTAKDPKYDPETYKKDSGSGWSGKHDKPHGGMHTGGGALALPSASAGGLAVLAVAGTGLYAVRRKRALGSVA